MLNIQADLLLYGPTTEAIRSQGSRGMNDAASVTQIGYKCTFSSLFGTLVGTKARQYAQDSDCNNRENSCTSERARFNTLK